jgi:hypothetical protein
MPRIYASGPGTLPESTNITSHKPGELCRVREEQVTTEQYAALETTIYNPSKQPLTPEDLGVAEPINN